MPDQTSPFHIDVADLVARPGAQRRESIMCAADFGVEQSRLTERPLEASLLLEALTEGVLVSGNVEFVVHHTCNRCLREWEESGSIEVIQLYSHLPVEEEYQILPGEYVDVEQLLRDEITLSFPLTPLCRPNCAGLCPTCGADLNEAACSGHGEDTDSPFAVLRELFET